MKGGVLSGWSVGVGHPVIVLATATRIPAAWSYVEPEAGHLPWFQAPGCVLAAARRLAATSA